MKVHYTYEDYKEDINILRQLDIDHIVCVYRGSIPAGVHLSNLMDIPLSIVKFQHYDNKDTEVQLIHDAGLETSKKCLLLDDIYDTGKTMKLVLEYLGSNFTTDIHPHCFYGKSNDLGVRYDRIHTGDWVCFWWEELS